MANTTDASSMRAFLQGYLWACADDFASRHVVQPAAAEQGTSATGDYESFFLVRLASGTVLRVAVTVDAPVPLAVGGVQ